MTATQADLISQFRTARRDQSKAVLEGLHAIKHARRFGAAITCCVSDNPAHSLTLSQSLAPDLVPFLDTSLTAIPTATFDQLAPKPHATRLIALADRPAPPDLTSLLQSAQGPVILLDQPQHLGNTGAVIRAAAGLNAAAVITLGTIDPWHPSILRAAAGLHYALPVTSAPAFSSLPQTQTLIALDPTGTPLPATTLPANPIIAFGSERQGLSPDLLNAATHTIAIPMANGVSSLNLATSVAITLHHLNCLR